MAGLNRGGLETFVMNVYRNIDRTKVQFDFLSHTPNGDYAQEVQSMGGRVYGIKPRNVGFFAYYKSLDKFFKEHAHEYQAIHLHTSSLSMASCLFYAKKYGIKVRIIHAHSSSISGSKLNYILHFLTKPFVRFLATDYLGCSDKGLDWLYKNTGIRHKAIMINNGIDTNLFRFSPTKRERVRNTLKIGENTIVIGHVGRFFWVKNHKFLVNIFNVYHLKNKDSKLLLIGTGELEEEIRKQVKELRINDDVLFLGLRSDIPDLLQAMDIFIMPSFFEGLPVSLVEAQTSGLPILATDIISKDAQIIDYFYTLSLSHSAEDWANKIHKIVNSYQRKDTSEATKRKGFDVKTTVSFLINIYLKK